jgi:hypothetical protein
MGEWAKAGIRPVADQSYMTGMAGYSDEMRVVTGALDNQNGAF